MSFNAIIPWVVVSLMTVYVSGLSYYANHRSMPEPAFDFYGTSDVLLSLASEQGAGKDVVLGTFNNIIEGERQTVAAEEDAPGVYRVPFRVNSPRSAFLYINDIPIEIFLVPDSSLKVTARYDSENFEVDSLAFEGYTEGICRYYREKSRKFLRRHIRAYRNTVVADSLSLHAHILDSLAVHELAHLLIRSTPNELPQWFIHFEKNEILYQKAYLKLSNAYNRLVYPGYLDEIETHNEEAVFSYYYYLYLKALIQSNIDVKEDQPSTALELLAVADTLLMDEVRDVYLTSTIFDFIRNNELTQASELLQRFSGTFSKKKYERFLQKQLAERG